MYLDKKIKLYNQCWEILQENKYINSTTSKHCIGKKLINDNIQKVHNKKTNVKVQYATIYRKYYNYTMSEEADEPVSIS